MPASATLIGLDPTGSRPTPTGRVAAPRPRSLDGAVIGLVANGLGETVAFFDAIHRELSAHVDFGGHLDIVKPSLSTAPTPDDWQRLVSQATVAITGFGGCGSCSSRALRDAMELEWEGIPSVAIVHRALTPALKVMAEMSGMADYRYVIVDYPHIPIARWTPEEIASLAKEVAPQILDLLVQPKGALRA